MNELNILSEYLRDVSKYSRLSKQEELELILKIRKGSKVAKEKFINSNLRLVVKIAKEFKPNKEISFMDIIQNGNMGLIKAIEKFEPERGLSFSNYAAYWIRQAIIRGFQKSKYSGGASYRRIESYKRIVNFIKEYEREKNNIPSIKEIEKNVKCNRSEILDILNTVKGNGNFFQICETNDFLLLNFPDNSYNPEKVLEKNIVREDLKKVFSSLSNSRDQNIIEERYGLKEEGKKSLSDLSKKYCLSIEGIRQIEKRIFNYIRIKYPFLSNYIYN